MAEPEWEGAGEERERELKLFCQCCTTCQAGSQAGRQAGIRNWHKCADIAEMAQVTVHGKW